MGKVLAGLLCVVMCLEAAAQRRRRPSGPPPAPAPTHPCEEAVGSWTRTCNLAPLGWTAVDAPIPGTPGLRFWRRTACKEDVANAEQLVAKSREMWDFLTGFMDGKQPLFDGDVGCAVGNFGGPQLDIFLRHYRKIDTTGTRPIPYDGEKVCRPVPTHVHLRGDRHTDYAVVHELIHSIQYASEWPETIAHCPDDPVKLRWWSEATAAAGDALYLPGRNSRKTHITHYLSSPQEPLDSKRSEEGYTVYLFPLFLDHMLGRGVIGRTWKELKTSSSVVEAIANSTGSDVADGFLTMWPEFTRHLLNEEPWNLFHTLDGVDQGVKPEEHELALASNEPDRTIELKAAELKRLSATFHRVQVGEGVRSLTIVNPNAKSPDPRVRIRVLIRKEGGVNEEDDWTDDPSKFFCIDKRAERVTELVFVISNSEWEPGAEPKKLEPLKVIATNVGCWRYSGRARMERNGQQLWRFKEFTFAMNLTQRGATGDAVFDLGPFPAGSIPIQPPPEMRAFLGAGGRVQWSWNGTWTPIEGCGGGTGTGSEAVTNGFALLFYGNGSRPDQPRYREYFANGFVNATFNVCGTATKEQIAFLHGNALTIAPDGHLRVESTRTETNNIGTMRETLSWDLAPQREQ